MSFSYTQSQFELQFPCDGHCSIDFGPNEYCSRHGRTPSELWQMVAEKQTTLNRVQELADRVESWEDGRTNVSYTYMAQAIRSAIGADGE